jgi:hypothetical protein
MTCTPSRLQHSARSRTLKAISPAAHSTQQDSGRRQVSIAVGRVPARPSVARLHHRAISTQQDDGRRQGKSTKVSIAVGKAPALPSVARHHACSSQPTAGVPPNSGLASIGAESTWVLATKQLINTCGDISCGTLCATHHCITTKQAQHVARHHRLKVV